MPCGHRLAPTEPAGETAGSNPVAPTQKQDTDHPVKIAGKYLGPEAIKHLLRYKYNELFAVAKNMYSANIPVNKPDSYYLTALDNQLRINNPAEYAAMESQEQ